MSSPSPLEYILHEAPAYLGYLHGETPDPETARLLAQAAEAMVQASTPRATARRFALSPGLSLLPGGPALEGSDIAAHLAGCHAVYLTAATLGPGAETAIRTAGVLDMRQSVLLDACASAYIEWQANQQEAALRREVEAGGEYLTGRFSPGYGNLPIAFQKALIRLLDGPRAIGLSVSASGILLPRKSITALLGVAQHPVTGRLAGCQHCLLFEKCEKRKEGIFCGNPQ